MLLTMKHLSSCEKISKFVCPKRKRMITGMKDKNVKVSKPRKATVSKSVKDYGNDPFFIRKANDSQKFLEKNGFPAIPKNK